MLGWTTKSHLPVRFSLRKASGTTCSTSRGQLASSAGLSASVGFAPLIRDLGIDKPRVVMSAAVKRPRNTATKSFDGVLGFSFNEMGHSGDVACFGMFAVCRAQSVNPLGAIKCNTLGRCVHDGVGRTNQPAFFEFVRTNQLFSFRIRYIS